MKETDKQIFDKTDGRCHMCGDPLEFGKRGQPGKAPPGSWVKDHVEQRGRLRLRAGQVTPLQILAVKGTRGDSTIHRFTERAQPGRTGCGKDAKGAQPVDRPRFELLPGEKAKLCGWCDRVNRQEGPGGFAIRESHAQLPACNECNQLRWMDWGENFRRLLRYGRIAVEELKHPDRSPIAGELERLRKKKDETNARRRVGNQTRPDLVGAPSETVRDEPT